MRNKNITLTIFLSREKERIARWVCATLSGCFRYGFRFCLLLQQQHWWMRYAHMFVLSRIPSRVQWIHDTPRTAMFWLGPAGHRYCQM
jgi:hypothetical protein